jgi:hypothetical protein
MDTNGREMEDPAAAHYHSFYSRFFASIRGFLSSFLIAAALRWVPLREAAL